MVTNALECNEVISNSVYGVRCDVYSWRRWSSRFGLLLEDRRKERISFRSFPFPYAERKGSIPFHALLQTAATVHTTLSCATPRHARAQPRSTLVRLDVGSTTENPSSCCVVREDRYLSRSSRTVHYARGPRDQTQFASFLALIFNGNGFPAPQSPSRPSKHETDNPFFFPA